MAPSQSTQNFPLARLVLCAVFMLTGFATRSSQTQVDGCSPLFGCDSLSCDAASCCGDSCEGEDCICKRIRKCFAESGIVFSNNLTQHYFGTVSGGLAGASPIRDGDTFGLRMNVAF